MYTKLVKKEEKVMIAIGQVTGRIDCLPNNFITASQVKSIINT
ncbi:hypothetical protein [Clostridium tyrobutyricum]|nr:hypothetical protein [Clostridium tyrobutyricum]MEA5007198.1 hypothetical protein [Clostridium tyrobutyricum]